MLKNVLNQMKLKKFISDNKASVLDIYADWCPPCKTIAPIYKKMALEFVGKVKLLKVDGSVVDEVMNE